MLGAEQAFPHLERAPEMWFGGRVVATPLETAAEDGNGSSVVRVKLWNL